MQHDGRKASGEDTESNFQRGFMSITCMLPTTYCMKMSREDSALQYADLRHVARKRYSPHLAYCLFNIARKMTGMKIKSLIIYFEIILYKHSYFILRMVSYTLSGMKPESNSDSKPDSDCVRDKKQSLVRNRRQFLLLSQSGRLTVYCIRP